MGFDYFESRARIAVVPQLAEREIFSVTYETPKREWNAAARDFLFALALAARDPHFTAIAEKRARLRRIEQRFVGTVEDGGKLSSHRRNP